MTFTILTGVIVTCTSRKHAPKPAINSVDLAKLQGDVTFQTYYTSDKYDDSLKRRLYRLLLCFHFISPTY